VSETALVGGDLNLVVCVGDTVRRPTGPWSPGVHALLRHLETVGFDGAPRGSGEQILRNIGWLEEHGAEIEPWLG
jgi:hypothetical protein